MKKNSNAFTKEMSMDEKVQNILDDFRMRQENKRVYEESWLLNINFLLGNQNSVISSTGEIVRREKLYPYESEEVFNHIAPIVEARLAKLGKVRPILAVRPASNSESDRELAKISKMVLDSELSNLDISCLLKSASVWSEVTGTAFYKITQDPSCSAGVNISVISPFEIFPESSAIEEIEDNPSIIHARSVCRSVAEEVYHLDGLKGEDMTSLSLDSLVAVTGRVGRYSKTAEEVKKDQVMVIERYTKPSAGFPNGYLEILVGDRLVYEGDIPFGVYPFIKQVSNSSLGSFWGTTVIERCIPVQRAYNAVKNRKIEFLNRLASGVLAVEEGSVDLDQLEDEGLAPGKILVYRSGSSSPRFMDGFQIPPELNREEDRLIQELNQISGVSELMRSSLLPSNVSSGTAINQLTEADDTRLSVSAEHIRQSLLHLSKLFLKILKKTVSKKKMSRLFDEKGAVEVFYWNGSDLKADDIVLDTTNELSDSISSRRTMAMELFRAGLFSDADGKLDSRAKSKFLDILGFGNFESAQDITEAHIKRAKAENLSAEDIMVLEIDDHKTHIQEHTRYIIENPELTQEKIDKVIAHIRMHSNMAGVSSVISGGKINVK